MTTSTRWEQERTLSTSVEALPTQLATELVMMKLHSTKWAEKKS